MSRWFNTAGPCKPDDHFMLPATARLPTVLRLIERQQYFVLHAPRQTGKTTALLTLGQELTAAGRYAAVLLSAEVGAPFGLDTGWLVIFDRRGDLPPIAERTTATEATSPAGRRVVVVRG